jgi:hypothetical protein
MNFRDVELLSAYLDGQLSPSDSVKLESRLGSDPELRAIMEDLRTARGLLRQLPQRNAPRNFILTPKMTGLKAPVPRVYPTLRLATVLATLLFVITFAVNGFAPLAASHLASAPAPAYGLGGGGGCNNCGLSEPATSTTQAPAQPFSALVPTAAAPNAQDNNRNLGTPTSELAPKAAAPFSANNQPTLIPGSKPIPPVWQISFGLLALICGGGAWLLRQRNEREFRKRWTKK